MTDLNFYQCFGASATQSIDFITIQKSELPGLTPTTSNNAEALVVGILIKILANFEGLIVTENGVVITNESGVNIGYNQGDIYELIQLIHWRDIFRTRQSINYRIYQLVFQEFQEYASD